MGKYVPSCPSFLAYLVFELGTTPEVLRKAKVLSLRVYEFVKGATPQSSSSSTSSIVTCRGAVVEALPGSVGCGSWAP